MSPKMSRESVVLYAEVVSLILELLWPVCVLTKKRVCKHCGTQYPNFVRLTEPCTPYIVETCEKAIALLEDAGVPHPQGNSLDFLKYVDDDQLLNTAGEKMFMARYYETGLGAGDCDRAMSLWEKSKALACLDKFRCFYPVDNSVEKQGTTGKDC